MSARETIVLMTGVVLCLALAAPAAAQKRDPTIQATATPPPMVPAANARRTTPVRGVLPDVTCQIQAWEDAAKTKPIQNGQQLLYGGGLPGAWIEVRAKNQGGASAGGFNVTTTVNNGGQVTNQNYVVPSGLGSGIGYVFPAFEIKFGNKTKQIQVSATTDVGGQVGESSESNNICSLAFSSTVVQ